MSSFSRYLPWSLFFTLILASANLSAQLKSVITHYSPADGLSNNKVSNIIKDAEGFMWIATWSGLNRFDGHNFLTFKTYPGDKSGLNNDRILEIADDKKGNIWTRAYDSRIYIFRKNTQEFIPLSKWLNFHRLGVIGFSKILHVSDGNVWLATQNQGVFKITQSSDGNYHFTRFAKEMQKSTRLASNKILLFHIDKKGSAWIGTTGGISVFSKYPEKDGLSGNLTNRLKGVVANVIRETDSGLWIGTKAGDIMHLDSKTGGLSTSKVFSGEVTGLLLSLRRKQLISTSSHGEIAFSSFSGTLMDKRIIAKERPLHSIYEDKSGLLWIEPPLNGVIKYDPEKRSIKHYTQINNTNYRRVPEDFGIFEDNNGVVWVAMKGCGFGFYNKQTDLVEYFYNHPDNPNKRFSNMILCMYYDPSGVLWLSTDAGGVDKIVFQSNDFKSINVFNSKYKPDIEVRAVLTDHLNRLWVGTKSGRLSVFAGSKKIDNIFSATPENKDGIYTLLEDKKGRVWVGTKFNGLYKGEPLNKNYDSYKFSHYKSNDNKDGLNTNIIYALMEDQKGRIWAGSYEDGLILFRENKSDLSFLSLKNSFKSYPKENFAKIRCLQEDKFGNIWVGTTEGLLLFNPEGNPNTFKYKVYSKIAGDVTSVSNNDIQYILKRRNGEMWICTSGGLSRAIFQDPLKGMKFENFSTKNGLPGDFVLSGVEDNDSNLWLATENGISKFFPKKKKFQNFGLYDGLSLASFSEGTSAKLKNGDIVFGSTEGLWTFSPNKIGLKKIDANLALINLRINNVDIYPSDTSILKQPLNITKSITLKHNQNTISIEFAVLDYRLDKRDNYAYRLVGFDDEWKLNKNQRSVTYTNLNPGKYEFQVRSETEYLYNKVLQRSIAIEILPPPWKTWWAYLIYSFLIVALSLISIRLVSMFLKLKHRIAVDKQVANMKLSFFTQVSHELRTPLTLIVNPAEEILQSETLSPKGKRYINLLLKNARRMVNSVNQLLDLQKAQSGQSLLRISQQDIVSFSKDMANYFTEVIETKNLKLNFTSNEDEILVWFDPEKLDIVLYNLLANAIKFSDNNHGEVNVNITKLSEDNLTIEINDNGPGVSNQELEDIFKLYYEGVKTNKGTKGSGIGLALSRELVELHKGEIFARQNFPKGLSVVVNLKLGTSHHDQRVLIQHDSEKVAFTDSVDLIPEIIEEANTELAEKPVLVLVDDNEDLRNFLTDKLSDFYEIVTAENGLEGLNKTRSLLPDLVLSDIMMPVMDGIALLDSIKNDKTTSHIPVVLLTAKFSVETQIESLKYGADYYITKPFKMELLQAAIHNLINQRKQLFNALVDKPKVDVKESHNTAITEYDKAFLKKIIAVVEERMADLTFNIEDVAEGMAISRSVFYKKFKSLTNIAPVEFVREIRLNKAKELFDLGERSVSIVAYKVGFNNPKYFSTCFRIQFNETPSEYIKKLKAES